MVGGDCNYGVPMTQGGATKLLRPFKTFNGSTVREASWQASSPAFSSEPVEESP
jgi:hypothetical protein